MVVQYLVGLCCMRNDLNASEITIGDWVYDEAAQKDRDVDITVTVPSTDGSLQAFKAVEVKHEARPLDVTKVEQLCLKLADMPDITQKSIVSTSGYTKGAIAKALKHKTDLYTLKKWDQPIGEDFPDFKGAATPGEFISYLQTNMLYWVDQNVFLEMQKGPRFFAYDYDSPALDSSGKVHEKYSTMRDYLDSILFRSTSILVGQEPAITIARAFPYGMTPKNEDYLAGPAWPHTHTMELANDEVYWQGEEGQPLFIQRATITGQLQ
jgi:hypothetical protein